MEEVDKFPNDFQIQYLIFEIEWQYGITSQCVTESWILAAGKNAHIELSPGPLPVQPADCLWADWARFSSRRLPVIWTP